MDELTPAKAVRLSHKRMRLLPVHMTENMHRFTYPSMVSEGMGGTGSSTQQSGKRTDERSRKIIEDDSSSEEDGLDMPSRTGTPVAKDSHPRLRKKRIGRLMMRVKKKMRYNNEAKGERKKPEPDSAKQSSLVENVDTIVSGVKSLKENRPGQRREPRGAPSSSEGSGEIEGSRSTIPHGIAMLLKAIEIIEADNPQQALLLQQTRTSLADGIATLLRTNEDSGKKKNLQTHENKNGNGAEETRKATALPSTSALSTANLLRKNEDPGIEENQQTHENKNGNEADKMDRREPTDSAPNRSDDSSGTQKGINLQRKRLLSVGKANPQMNNCSENMGSHGRRYCKNVAKPSTRQEGGNSSSKLKKRTCFRKRLLPVGKAEIRYAKNITMRHSAKSANIHVFEPTAANFEHGNELGLGVNEGQVQEACEGKRSVTAQTEFSGQTHIRSETVPASSP